MKVMVGGTFDPLHEGHKKLLRRTFSLAGRDGEVVIGLTTDQFATLKSHPVRPYMERKAQVEKFIRDQGFTTSWMIEPLADRFGPAVDADFDALVVSEETLPVGIEINVLRRKKGMKKVDLHQIACVLAEDGKWISSTRVYRGEIDTQGHLLQHEIIRP